MASYSTRPAGGESNADCQGDDPGSSGSGIGLGEVEESCAGRNGAMPRETLVFLDDAAESFVAVFSRGWPAVMLWATSGLVVMARGYLLHQRTGQAGRPPQGRRLSQTAAK